MPAPTIGGGGVIFTDGPSDRPSVRCLTLNASEHTTKMVVCLLAT